MAISVQGGLDTVNQGVDDVRDATKKLADGDVKGALRSGFEGQQEVKKGLLKTALGALTFPFRLLTGPTENGTAQARDGAQASIQKRIG